MTLRVGKNFVHVTLKHDPQKKKTDKLDFVKIKLIFKKNKKGKLKENTCKLPILSLIKVIPRIYKDLLKSNYNINNLLKIDKRYEQKFHQRRYK